MAQKKDIDWEAIEAEYRPNKMPLRDIGDKHGCSETLIRRTAKKEGWVRDLSDTIKHKADDLVRKAAVRKHVRNEYATATENEVVEANALDNATIQINERKDVARARSVSMALLNELESQVIDKELYQRLGELMDSPDEVLRLLAKEYMAATGRKNNARRDKETLLCPGNP